MRHEARWEGLGDLIWASGNPHPDFNDPPIVCCCDRATYCVVYDDHPSNNREAGDNDLHQLYVYPDGDIKCIHCNREWRHA